MYEKDYILRIIEGVGVALQAMLVGLREHRPDDVLTESQEALTLIFGMPAHLTDALTPAGLVTLLSAGGGFDSERGRLAAEVFVRRVQAQRVSGLPESAEADLAKALRLISAVTEFGDEEQIAEARALLADLEVADLPEEGGAA